MIDILYTRQQQAFSSLLGFVIPDADGAIQRTGGNEGFADAGSEASDGRWVQRVQQVFEMGRLSLEKPHGNEIQQGERKDAYILQCELLVPGNLHAKANCFDVTCGFPKILLF